MEKYLRRLQPISKELEAISKNIAFIYESVRCLDVYHIQNSIILSIEMNFSFFLQIFLLIYIVYQRNMSISKSEMGKLRIFNLKFYTKIRLMLIENLKILHLSNLEIFTIVNKISYSLRTYRSI